MKNCPFCGGKAVLHKCSKSHKYYVKCENCHARTRKEILDTEAMRAWDMRRDTVPNMSIDVDSINATLNSLKDLRDRIGKIVM